MEQYIPKSVIMAEIERLVNNYDKALDYEAALEDVRNFIDTLEVKKVKEEPVSDDLEEAAKRYGTEGDEICGLYIIDEEVDAFKAGAKWKEQQMMAKAVDAHCFGFQGAALFSFRLPASNYLVGSEVKVIVIKED